MQTNAHHTARAHCDGAPVHYERRRPEQTTLYRLVQQHAAVRVEAHERKRLEQLCRYITRPALSDERVQLNAAGQVALKLKTPWRDGTTHLVMSRLRCRIPIATGCGYPAAGVVLRAVSASHGQHQGQP